MKKHLFNILLQKEITIQRFLLILTLLTLFIYNLPVFKYAHQHLELFSLHYFLVFLSLFVALFSINIFLFTLFSALLPVFIMKAFFIIFVLINSIALYFTDTYNVILDKTMMGNIFNTNSEEAFSYYSFKLIIYFFCLGIIPAFVISKTSIKRTHSLKSFFTALTTLILAVLILYLNSSTWLWLDKHAKTLGGLSMPWSYSINAIRYKLKTSMQKQTKVLLPDATFKNNNKMLVVLVIGESARAANFSLYNYAIETNPKLKKQSLEVLHNTTSTTTYTTASIHSMLSYKASTSDNFETLPNYLYRNGVDVIWRSNNWGEPKLAIKYHEQAGILQQTCIGEECRFDGVLLTNLKEKILSMKKNKIFVVLHTEGSHGPSYYEKHPKNFAFFKPFCKSVNLSRCTQQELINAYNNTILYTDHFLNNTIEELKKLHTIPTLFLYISDHGESLGEYNFYLHGTPYALAPHFQKEIPFFIWQSKDFKLMKHIKQQNTYGHNNIFHTVLGAFDIQSKVYNQELDLLVPVKH